MDMMTAIFAANKAKKDLTKSGQIGYAETSVGYLRFDGDLSGKFCIPASDMFEGMDSSQYYVRLSTTPIKGTQIERIVTSNGVEVDADLCNIIDENGCVMVTSSYVYTGIRDDFVLVLSLPAESGMGGVYVFGAGDCYISGVYGNLVETVHTIDPKYLPPSSGGGLPVIDISEQVGLEPVMLTAEEIAQLEAVYAEHKVVVVNLLAYEFPTPILCSRVPTTVGYVGPFMQGRLILGIEDGVGMIVVVE